MTKYRKKPVIVEAWLWDGSPETLRQIIKSGLFDVRSARAPDPAMTYEERLITVKGHYIIADAGGHHYCKPDIFKETYEAVDDDRRDEKHDH